MRCRADFIWTADSCSPQTDVNTGITASIYPKYSRIFAGRRLQPQYTSTTRYLSVCQNAASISFLVTKGYVGPRLYNGFQCLFLAMKRADNSVTLPALVCVPSK